MTGFYQYKKIIYKIVGAAMEVHNTLRWGLLEAIYNEALHKELLHQGIDNVQEQLLACYYKGERLEKFYKMDIVVGDIIIELKSVKELNHDHRAQLFNYLRLTQKPIGLLINFGQPLMQGERYGYIEENNECVLLDKDMNMMRIG